jgi:hypothetical protein
MAVSEMEVLVFVSVEKHKYLAIEDIDTADKITPKAISQPPTKYLYTAGSFFVAHFRDDMHLLSNLRHQNTGPTLEQCPDLE